jgi:hypothetical protein
MYQKTTRTIIITMAAIFLGSVAFSQVKISGPTPFPTGATATTTASKKAAPSSAAMNAEKEKIWKSPTMLHARAWVQEYCQRSAKITPAEGQQYMDELERLSPAQMKLWLLKYEAEQEHIQAQQAAFEHHRKAMVGQALSVEKQTEKSYADINQGETDAAKLESKSLAKEKQFSQQMMKQNASERAQTTDSMLNPYNMFGYGGYGAHGGYGGGYHFHYHVHH